MSTMREALLAHPDIDLDWIVRTPDDIWHLIGAEGADIAAWSEADGGWDYYDERTESTIWYDGSPADLTLMLTRIADAQRDV